MRGVRNSLTMGRLAINTSKGLAFRNGEFNKLIRIYEKWFCFFQMLDDVVLRVLVLFVVYQNN